MAVIRSVQPLSVAEYFKFPDYEVRSYDRSGPSDRLTAQIGHELASAVGVSGDAAHPIMSRRAAQQYLAWRDLDSLLEYGDVSPSRLSIVRDGRTVETSRYLRRRTVSGFSMQTLQAGAVRRLFESGASLVYRSVELSNSEVARVAEDLQFVTGESVVVNLYATPADSPGFSLHWDDHDSLIVQQAGVKRWELARPTAESPLAPHDQEAPEETDMHVELTAGDALFVPRGWWHRVDAASEGSLHLTYGIRRRTAYDAALILLDVLAENPSIRRDIALEGVADAITPYAKDIQDHVEDYARLFPGFHRGTLPLRDAPSFENLGGGFQAAGVALRTPAPATVLVGSDEFVWAVDQRVFRLDRAALRAFETLAKSEVIREESIDMHEDRRELRSLIDAFMAYGLITAIPSK